MDYFPILPLSIVVPSYASMTYRTFRCLRNSYLYPGQRNPPFPHAHNDRVGQHTGEAQEGEEGVELVGPGETAPAPGLFPPLTTIYFQTKTS